jgi:hypothetical protein
MKEGSSMYKQNMTMKGASLLVLSVLAMMVNGCATMPTAKELAKAEYGSPISQQDAEAKAIEYLKQRLKDPDSAKIEWGAVQQGWMREAPINGNQLRFGYILTANINAKNSFGGYIGYRPYQFVFFNGVIVSVYAQQEISGSYGSTPYMGKIY